MSDNAGGVGCLFNHYRGCDALTVLPETLAYFEATFLHDFEGGLLGLGELGEGLLFLLNRIW